MIPVTPTEDNRKHPIRGHLYRNRDTGNIYVGAALPDIIEGKIVLLTLTGLDQATNAWYGKGFDEEQWTHLGPIKRVEY